MTPSKDTKTATQAKMLRDWARRHGIKDFFDIGRNGVCHALFPEKGFIRPGYTVIMGDSHTCTHGAFGAFAAGVGTTDLEVGDPEGRLRLPRAATMKVNAHRQPAAEGSSPRTSSCTSSARIGVNGATDRVDRVRRVRWSTPWTMESRMTLCNMAVEAGGTSGICHAGHGHRRLPLAVHPERLLRPQGSGAGRFPAAGGPTPDAAYEQVVDHRRRPASSRVTTFGYKPDQVKPVREMAGTPIDQVYIGSCTNGRMEDLRVAAAVLKGQQIQPPRTRHRLPGHARQSTSEAMHEGLIEIFMDAGFCVTNPTCGACLGMSNGVLAEGEVCASTTNRNFMGRMGKGGMVHLMCPATAAAWP